MPNHELGPEEYLLYEIVHQSNLKESEVHKTELHKLSYLIYKDFDNESVPDQELALPAYWYEHGIMVDFDQLSTHFLNFEFVSYDSSKGEVIQVDDDISTSNFDIVPELAEWIQEKARKYIDEFGQTYGVRAVKDATYERFGNEFVQQLNEFRYQLDGLENKDVVNKDEYAPTEVAFSEIVNTAETDKKTNFEDVDDQALLENLNGLIAAFPDQEYDKMEDEFYEWESITRQLIYNSMYSQLNNFTSEFWNAFSQVVLRVEHNENLPQTKVFRWKRDRKEALDDFEDEIGRYRSVLLKNRDQTDVLESVSQEYDEAVDETFDEFRHKTH